MRVTISVTRPATLIRQRRIVSNCASRQKELRAARLRRLSNSQYAAVWISSRNWLAVALRQEVRSEAGEVELVCFDQVLGLPPRAIDLVVERLGQARQIGDDEAAVGTLSPGLDARDDAALGIPAFGCVTEIAVAADLLRFARDAAQGGVLRERADPAQ